MVFPTVMDRNQYARGPAQSDGVATRPRSQEWGRGRPLDGRREKSIDLLMVP